MENGQLVVVNTNQKQTKLSHLLTILYAPTNTFRALGQSPKLRWLIFILLTAHIGITFFVSEGLLETNEMQGLLNQNDVQMPAAVLNLIKFLIVLFSSLWYFFMLFIVYLLQLAVVKFMKLPLGGKALGAIILLSQVPQIIGKILQFPFFNPDQLQNEEAQIAIGSLGLLVSQFTTDGTLIRLAANVNIFEIWSYALIGLGISVATACSIKKGFLASFVIWALVFVLNTAVIFLLPR